MNETTGSTNNLKGTVAIGDMGYAFELMAKSFYDSRPDAIKEFVVNSVEAGATQVVVIV